MIALDNLNMIGVNSCICQHKEVLKIVSELIADKQKGQFLILGLVQWVRRKSLEF